MDYAKLQTTAGLMVKTYGVPVTVNRLGVRVISAYGVLTKQKQDFLTAPSSSLAVTTKADGKLVLLSVTGKNVPQVDDELVLAQVSYSVTGVEVIKPGATAILYKVDVV